MKRSEGVVPASLMNDFPSRTGADTFLNWIANHVNVEQLIAVAGFLDPEFFDVDGLLLWNHAIAQAFETRPRTTPFGSDPTTVERYCNLLNISEMFILSADAAVDDKRLVTALAQAIKKFWSAALATRFPERVYLLEVAEDLYDEEGVCLTFWRKRDEPDGS